jgi:hypothetical protein
MDADYFSVVPFFNKRRAFLLLCLSIAVDCPVNGHGFPEGQGYPCSDSKPRRAELGYSDATARTLNAHRHVHRQ